MTLQNWFRPRLVTSLLRTLLMLLGTGVLLAPATDPARAQSFAGKPITLTIGYAPGSGNDILGRLVSRHIGKHIPGQPRVVAQNMPGAGSFKAANYLYGAAPRDGTVLGYIAQTAATEELLGSPAVQFKAARFSWIGRISSYNLVTAFWHTSKVKTLSDALAHEATLGATGVGSTVYIYPNVLNRVLGTKFKIVSGYEGTTQSALAMERGEVEGMSTGWFSIKTTKKDWLDNRKINIVVQFVAERHPDLPDVPTMVDVARTPEERQLFRLFSNEGDIGKAIMAPPDLPPATLTTLRRAFDAMARDPEFIADADRLQVERDSMPGEKLQKMIEAVAQTPPAIIGHAKALLK